MAEQKEVRIVKVEDVKINTINMNGYEADDGKKVYRTSLDFGKFIKAIDGLDFKDYDDVLEEKIAGVTKHENENISFTLTRNFKLQNFDGKEIDTSENLKTNGSQTGTLLFMLAENPNVTRGDKRYLAVVGIRLDENTDVEIAGIDVNKYFD